MTPPEALGDDAVRERLAALPHWTLDDGWIRRRYATQGYPSALIVVAVVGHLAQTAWHHPEMTVSYGSVEVRLQSDDAGGVTERDLALAARIEEVVAWRPGAEDGPFSGTPDDPQYAHVLPDE